MVDAFAADQEKPEVLKTLPPKDYLYRTIIPALVPALEACQRDRPADPIEFIAFYMLRHPKQYSKALKA
jgi:protein dpy-30